MTFLAIDYGTRRIGLAIGDDETKIASPITTVAARGILADQVRCVLRHAEPYDVDAFVVGLPKNMDDSEGEQARLVRRFGAELGRQTGKPIHYVDERLSSHAADELLRPASLTRKRRKARQDAVAAQVILEGFLNGTV